MRTSNFTARLLICVVIPNLDPLQNYVLYPDFSSGQHTAWGDDREPDIELSPRKGFEIWVRSSWSTLLAN